MNNKRLVLALFVLVLLLALVYVAVQSQQSKESKAHFETILVGKGSLPKWSPDGTKLAFICAEGICVTDSSGKGEIKKIGPFKIKNYEWMSDSELVVYEWEYGRIKGVKTLTARIKKANLDGKIEVIKESHPTFEAPYPYRFTMPIVFKDGTVGYYEHPNGDLKEEPVFQIIKEGRLKPEVAVKQMILGGVKGEKGIWLVSPDKSIKKRVTEKEYRFVQLAPDGSKFIGKNSRGQIIVFDSTGNEIANLGSGLILSEGKTGNWSPDSKKIVYFDTEEDGHYVLASEIYLINVDGSGKIQITDTPDVLEHDPVWSPDGTKIAYWTRDLKWEKLEVFIMRLK